MSANITGINWNAGEMDVTAEFDLSAANAITATRGDDVIVTNLTGGNFSVVFKGTKGIKLVETLSQGPSIRGAIAGNITGARITSITQGGGTYGDDITVLVSTTVSAGTAAATTSAITVSLWFAFRIVKMVSPI